MPENNVQYIECYSVTKEEEEIKPLQYFKAIYI
jgi:hypothetical protein